MLWLVLIFRLLFLLFFLVNKSVGEDDDDDSSLACRLAGSRFVPTVSFEFDKSVNRIVALVILAAVAALPLVIIVGELLVFILVALFASLKSGDAFVEVSGDDDEDDDDEEEESDDDELGDKDDAEHIRDLALEFDVLGLEASSFDSAVTSKM